MTNHPIDIHVSVVASDLARVLVSRPDLLIAAGGYQDYVVIVARGEAGKMLQTAFATVGVKEPG